MYNLIIVDDETIIRRGLKNYIPWEELGFRVTADFEDGKEAIPYIEENPVDAVLTDIRMVNVSGLDLAEYISKHRPAIKTVILSGYKEFDYARKAMEFQVKNYLLKPINQDEIINTFKELRAELDQERNVPSEIPAELDNSLSPLACQEELVQAVTIGEKEKAESLVRTIPPMAVGALQQCCVDFFAALTNRLKELGTDFNGLEGNLNYKFVYILQGEIEIKTWLSDNISAVMERLEKSRQSDSETLVARAVSYIDENYRDDPSREEVAEYLSLNSSYFSRLFKERTGKTFSEYVTKVKIGKAMELMKGKNYHVYEISRLAGFSSSKYFARVFKKETGYRPLDYMRLKKRESK